MTASMNGQLNERTRDELENLAKEAGFSQFRVACCACIFSVVESIKNS